MTQYHLRARPAAGLTALLLLSTSWIFAAAPAAASGTEGPLSDEIVIQNGTTDAFDGGNQLQVRAGNQAFGVVYGSPAYPNGALTFYGIVVHTLGSATVHDARTDRVIADNITMPVVTVVAQRFEAIVEFRDQNADGIFDFAPNLTSRDPVDFAAHEPVVKGVSLHGVWNLTDFSLDAVSDDHVLINFTLSRQDLPYVRVDVLDRPQNMTVDRVAFTVHLDITRQQVDGVEVPHFDASVDRRAGGAKLVSVTPDGMRTYNATVTTGHFKVDHDIVGWDPAPARGDVQSRLLLINGVLFMTGISPRLAPWLNEVILDGQRGGSATAPEDNGTSREINASAPLDRFERVQAIMLHDAWRGLGGLSWNQTVDVYRSANQTEPAEANATYQVLGGTRAVVVREDLTFKGFLLVGGYVYPAAYRVYHDPELSAQGVEVQGSSVLPGLLPALILAAEVFLVVGAIVGAVALAAVSSSAKAKQRREGEAQRIRAFQERYRLPPSGGGGVG